MPSFCVCKTVHDTDDSCEVHERKRMSEKKKEEDRNIMSLETYKAILEKLCASFIDIFIPLTNFLFSPSFLCYQRIRTTLLPAQQICNLSQQPVSLAQRLGTGGNSSPGYAVEGNGV